MVLYGCNSQKKGLVCSCNTITKQQEFICLFLEKALVLHSHELLLVKSEGKNIA